MFSRLGRFFAGPDVYRVYNEVATTATASLSGTLPAGTPGGFRAKQVDVYPVNTAEKCGGLVISLLSTFWNLGLYSSPFIVLHMYKKDMLNLAWAHTFGNVCGVALVTYMMALNLRAVGRAANPTYREFLEDLDAAVSSNMSAAAKRTLMLRYDFDFTSWPVEFRTSSSAGPSAGPSKVMAAPPPPEQSVYLGVMGLPLRAAAWMVVHSFGIKLVYPGSMSMIQSSISGALADGRAKLLLETGGERFKVETLDGNCIEVMFVDRRRSRVASAQGHGSTLVISCEGNAGFLEIGVLSTPLEAGYSVLGWNHPGFGGSTGTPMPSQELHAVDSVVQFAIQKLDFTPEQIIVHGWSIGGFTATWVAMNYPDIKGLVLDATFDSLLPLAVRSMPEFMETVVTLGVTSYINLDISSQLVKYRGPVVLIRRTMDEVISASPDNKLETNRGNHLLVTLLRDRFPELYGPDELDSLRTCLRMNSLVKNQFLQRLNISSDDEELDQLVSSAMNEAEASSGARFPCSLGAGLSQDKRIRLAVYLATKYMIDYDSTHCTPLPVQYFSAPWDPSSSNGEDTFVKV